MPAVARPLSVLSSTMNTAAGRGALRGLRCGVLRPDLSLSLGDSGAADHTSLHSSETDLSQALPPGHRRSHQTPEHTPLASTIYSPTVLGATP